MLEQTSLVAKPAKPVQLAPETRFARLASPSPAQERRRQVWTAIVVIAIAIALGGGLWVLSRRLAPEITAPVSSESAYVASFAEKSIAVLPFKNLGDGEQDPLLADALQDEILTALAKVGDLRVISRTSVESYTPAQPRNLREIAQSLGAGHILVGQVKPSREKIQVTVQLIDASRGVRLWNMSYEREPGAVSRRQSELVQRIATDLHATIKPEEKATLGERPTRDLVAYGFYVRGKNLVASVSSAQINDKLLQAVQVLGQAIARDPDFYLAYCELASAHDYLYFFGFDHTPVRLALAEAALKTVVRLRSNAGETHLARATFLYRCYLDYNKARAELALTQQALPNNSEAFEMVGYIDRREGLWTESSRSLQRALKLDPRNASLLQEIAASYQEFREFGAMAAALDRALTINPHDLDTRLSRASVDLEWRADTRPLRKTIEALLAENPDSASDLADQWFYLSLCRRDPAAVAHALAAIPPAGISTDLNLPRSYCVALAATARGDTAAARRAFLVARAEVEKTVRAQPDYGPVYTVLGLIDAGLGRKEEAMREGRRALELLPVRKDAMEGPEQLKYLAVIYALCGEKNLALDEIAATLKIPSTLSYGNLKLHPYWDALRGDPRFEKIVASLAPRN
jgi:TolB-like protein/tetratricopeptide (TPR) repeat protein